MVDRAKARPCSIQGYDFTILQTKGIYKPMETNLLIGIQFYPSAYTTEKTFSLCPQYRDWTDRGWYYQHSNYKQVVRDHYKRYGQRKGRALISDLKNQLDSYYDSVVRPVYEASNSHSINEADKAQAEVDRLTKKLAEVRKELNKEQVLNQKYTKALIKTTLQRDELLQQLMNVKLTYNLLKNAGIVTKLGREIIKSFKK